MTQWLQHEKKIRSQNGEDGIIIELMRRIGVRNGRFVEIGCQDASECNCVALTPDWSGTWIDAKASKGQNGIPVRGAFITAENCNELVTKWHGNEPCNLLSIDIDGNDYWIWKSLTLRADVVIIEYNASVGADTKWVLPYDPKFRWDRRTDWFGASLASMTELAKSKGYSLITCESHGVNAFYVDDRLRSKVGEEWLLPIKDAYCPPNYFGRGRGHRRSSKWGAQPA